MHQYVPSSHRRMRHNLDHSDKHFNGHGRWLANVTGLEPTVHSHMNLFPLPSARDERRNTRKDMTGMALGLGLPSPYRTRPPSMGPPHLQGLEALADEYTASGDLDRAAQALAAAVATAGDTEVGGRVAIRLGEMLHSYVDVSCLLTTVTHSVVCELGNHQRHARSRSPMHARPCRILPPFTQHYH